MKHKFPFSYIGGTNTTAKIKKGASINLATYGVYLAPHKASGHNTCAMASKECIMGCLNTSGRVRMDKENVILKARINRTKAFYEDREDFMKLMIHELTLAERRALRNGEDFAVRLNGTSDLSPHLFQLDGIGVLDRFPHVQFYDYTKILKRTGLLERHRNYHLTFSFSGHNWTDCLKALAAGVSVAVVFDTKRGKPLPKALNGIRIIDGDVTDYRPADPKGVIVGLRWKLIKNKKNNDAILNSPFVVKTEGQVGRIVRNLFESHEKEDEYRRSEAEVRASLHNGAHPELGKDNVRKRQVLRAAVQERPGVVRKHGVPAS